VTGRIAGHLEAGYHELSNAKATVKGGNGKLYEHNLESFKELWREVGEKMATKWDVQAWFWRFGNITKESHHPWTGIGKQSMVLLHLLLQGSRETDVSINAHDGSLNHLPFTA
jgi:hypothetical protein